MKNNLQIFKNQEFGEVRTIEENAKIYFCGKDVALALGYADTVNAVKQHCKQKGVVKHHLLTKGGQQVSNFIDEGNVYRLITNSKLPQAEKFESWVFDEVMPTLRKTGTYSISDYKTQTLEVRQKNAKIREAQLMYKVAKETERGTYKEVLLANITKTLTGEYLLPLPRAERKLYDATEIGEMLGLSANKVGRLTNQLGLKTEEFGTWVWNKARNADKQVRCFMYYENVIDELSRSREAA